jgi:hypothetical protein
MTEPQPSDNAPDTENPDRINGGKLVLFFVVVVLVVAFAIAASANAPKPVRSSTYSPPEERHTIAYVVEGRGNVDITIENEFESTEQHTVKLPYSKEFKADSGQFVYLSAQKDSGGSGQITCLLLLDGQVAKKASTTAEYGICDVSGLVP